MKIKQAMLDNRCPHTYFQDSTIPPPPPAAEKFSQMKCHFFASSQCFTCRRYHFGGSSRTKKISGPSICPNKHTQPQITEFLSILLSIFPASDFLGKKFYGALHFISETESNYDQFLSFITG